MMLLKRLYRKFLKYKEDAYVEDSLRVWHGVKEFSFRVSTVRKAFRALEKRSFIEFALHLRKLLLSKNVFDFIGLLGNDAWDLWVYLSFLENEGLIRVKGKRVEVLEQELLNYFILPKSETQILRELRKRLKVPLNRLDQPFIVAIGKRFRWKYEFDQIPITASSVVFIVKKVLEWLPLKGKFLFVGDDDFVSIALATVESGLKLGVIDIDETLLETINGLADYYGLSIETRKVDIEKTRRINNSFYGFYTNPPYTELGVKKFVGFGVKHLSKDGGVAFLVTGDNFSARFLPIEEFFAKQRLSLWEMTSGRIEYPFMEIGEEDRVLKQRLMGFFDAKTLTRYPMEGANLLVLGYVPWKVEAPKLPKSVYCYL